MNSQLKIDNKIRLGFTLIELLVVISIIGILATLVTANLNAARSRARDSERKSDLRNIQTALRLYYNDKGRYPASDASYNILGCGSAGTTACTWEGEWSVGSTVYMKNLPNDPLPDESYSYQLGSDTDTYTLFACLENSSDTSGIANSNCSSGYMFQITQ
jgi:type II secretion system protein G